MTTVGILGGGQLGWMLSESLFAYGGTPRVLARPNDLAMQRVPHSFVGSWSDPQLLREFFAACDVVTIDVEHVDADALEPFAAKLVPSLDVIRLAQHRMLEKRFLASTGLPHAWFAEVSSSEQARDIAAQLDFPLILKVALGGYDGRGQFRLANEGDYHAAVETLGDAVDRFGFVLEEPLDLVAEASVVLARGAHGAVEFPVFDNEHRDHILDMTHLPSTLPADVQQTMRRIARQAADAMAVRGILTTEFLITRSPGRRGLQVGEHYVFVNEFAPRPHNSGHISRNACTLSQFDALARVLLDLPLEVPAPLDGAWCMANLLSDLWIDADDFSLARGLGEPGIVDVVLYGKEPARPRRKMGHAIARGATREEAFHRAESFRRRCRQP